MFFWYQLAQVVKWIVVLLGYYIISANVRSYQIHRGMCMTILPFSKTALWQIVHTAQSKCCSASATG